MHPGTLHALLRTSSLKMSSRARSRGVYRKRRSFTDSTNNGEQVPPKLNVGELHQPYELIEKSLSETCLIRVPLLFLSDPTWPCLPCGLHSLHIPALCFIDEYVCVFYATTFLFLFKMFFFICQSSNLFSSSVLYEWMNCFGLSQCI